MATKTTALVSYLGNIFSPLIFDKINLISAACPHTAQITADRARTLNDKLFISLLILNAYVRAKAESFILHVYRSNPAAIDLNWILLA